MQRNESLLSKFPVALRKGLNFLSLYLGAIRDWNEHNPNRTDELWGNVTTWPCVGKLLETSVEYSHSDSSVNVRVLSKLHGPTVPEFWTVFKHSRCCLHENILLNSVAAKTLRLLCWQCPCCGILVSHSLLGEDSILVECDAVSFGKWRPKFQGIVLPSLRGLAIKK